MTDHGRQIAYMRKLKSLKMLSRISVYVILGVFALWVLVPFSIILSTSFKTWQEANSLGFSFIPKSFTIEGYVNALTFTDFNAEIPLLVKGFINTILYVVPTTLLGLFTSSLSGYAFAKIDFRHKNLLFTLMIITMLIPGTIMIAPSYVMFDTIGWTGTPLPIIVPGMFGAAAAVFFMRQFYAGIPTDLVEAARVDGMSHLKIYFKIMVPLSKPALIAQGVLGFVAGYNDYFAPYIYLQDPSQYTIQIALRNFSGTYASQINALMAGSVAVLIPVFIIYIFAQRSFIEGIATTGMKF
jgi:multiple sugar transport system permease protein